MSLRAILCNYLTAPAINGDDAFAGVQGDAVAVIPIEVIQYDVAEFLLACEYRRQHDAVVIGVWFGTEYGDVVKVGGQFEQFFQGAYPGHAVTDQYEFELLHCACSA